MTFNKYIVYGFKNVYHTHTHIHEGFYRGLKHLFGEKAIWIDHRDGVKPEQLEGSLVISEHGAAKNGLPLIDSCFYVIHGLNNDAELRNRFVKSNHLGWNVYHDFSHGNASLWDNKTSFQTLDDYFKFLAQVPRDDSAGLHRVFLDEDVAFYPEEAHMDFRWATDLLPHEIEVNKQFVRPLNTDSRVINYVGTKWFVNEKELNAFSRACGDNGIQFRQYGAGQAEYNGKNVVSVEDNIRLIRESYFAPAIVGSHHLVEGYAPCRLFKNISYGCMGVTNSERMQQLFGGRLICETDPYKLFTVARDRLANTPVSEIHSLMDYVAEKHTYLNRLDAIFKAVKLICEY